MPTTNTHIHVQILIRIKLQTEFPESVFTHAQLAWTPMNAMNINDPRASTTIITFWPRTNGVESRYIDAVVAFTQTRTLKPLMHPSICGTTHVYRAAAAATASAHFLWLGGATTKYARIECRKCEGMCVSVWRRWLKIHGIIIIATFDDVHIKRDATGTRCWLNEPPKLIDRTHRSST